MARFTRSSRPNAYRFLELLNTVLALSVVLSEPSTGGEFGIQTTRQLPVSGFPDRFHRVRETTPFTSSETALIICDVWDSHHCVNAVRRVQEIAPRIDALASALRSAGTTVIHAPSDCMPFYSTHPARDRAKSTPTVTNLPNDIAKWCDRIPSEESASYPIDQSDGGEDDDPVEHTQWAEKLASEGRNPKAPWRQQIPVIKIDSKLDFISDSGNEIWNILASKGIRQVMICGVHTNMCVLGRPFGLRQLSSHGKNVVLPICCGFKRSFILADLSLGFVLQVTLSARATGNRWMDWCNGPNSTLMLSEETTPITLAMTCIQPSS